MCVWALKYAISAFSDTWIGWCGGGGAESFPSVSEKGHYPSEAGISTNTCMLLAVKEDANIFRRYARVSYGEDVCVAISSERSARASKQSLWENTRRVCALSDAVSQWHTGLGTDKLVGRDGPEIFETARRSIMI
jgi:hypothetical protein